MEKILSFHFPTRIMNRHHFSFTWKNAGRRTEVQNRKLPEGIQRTGSFSGGRCRGARVGMGSSPLFGLPFRPKSVYFPPVGLRTGENFVTTYFGLMTYVERHLIPLNPKSQHHILTHTFDDSIPTAKGILY